MLSKPVKGKDDLTSVIGVGKWPNHSSGRMVLDNGVRTNFTIKEEAFARGVAEMELVEYDKNLGRF